MRARGFGAALAAVVALAAPAAASETIVTGLIGSPNSGAWPYYIGIDKGFFAAAGIALDLVYVPTAAGLVQQLTGGSLDIVGTIGTVEPIHAIEKGAPVAILRLVGRVTPYEMVAKPSIQKFEDLKGKTICIGGLRDINRVYLNRIAEAHGLRDEGDYDIVVIGNTAQRFAALQSGTVDATMLVPPVNFIAEKAGFRNIGMIKDYTEDLPMGAADVSLAWAKTHMETARRIVGVLDRSIAWFDDDQNRDEAIDILARLMKGDRAEIGQAYDLMRRIDGFEHSNKVSRAKLVALIAAMKAMGDIEGTTPPERLVLQGVTELGD